MQENGRKWEHEESGCLFGRIVGVDGRRERGPRGDRNVILTHGILVAGGGEKGKRGCKGKEKTNIGQTLCKKSEEMARRGKNCIHTKYSQNPNNG